MNCYVFRVACAVVGILGGPIGVAFGFVIGYLLDTIASEYLVYRAVRGALINGVRLAAEGLIVPVCSAAVAVELLFDSHPTEHEQARCLDAISTCTASRLGKRKLSRVIATTASVLSVPQRSELHRPWRDQTEQVRRTVLEICDTLARGDDRASKLRAVAVELGLPRHLADSYIQRVHLDPESCEVLGVTPSASWDDVRTAYRRLAAQLHPDTMVGLTDPQREAAGTAFARIHEAYERLRAEFHKQQLDTDDRG